MNPDDLSPVMREAYELLPDNKKSDFLNEQEETKKNVIRGAIARIMTRNQSHNLKNPRQGK